MKNKNQNASEAKKSNRISTLAHETRKNGGGLRSCLKFIFCNYRKLTMFGVFIVIAFTVEAQQKVDTRSTSEECFILYFHREITVLTINNKRLDKDWATLEEPRKAPESTGNVRRDKLNATLSKIAESAPSNAPTEIKGTGSLFRPGAMFQIPAGTYVIKAKLGSGEWEDVKGDFVAGGHYFLTREAKGGGEVSISGSIGNRGSSTSSSATRIEWGLGIVDMTSSKANPDTADDETDEEEEEIEEG